METLNTTQATTLTHFPDTSTTTVSPRAGLLFRLTDHFSLRGAFYQGFRAPTLNELYRPFRVGNVQTNANAKLGPERLTGVEAGFNHSLGRGFFWRATGFWNRVKDPISNVTLSTTPALILRQRQNLGRLRVQGDRCGNRISNQHAMGHSGPVSFRRSHSQRFFGQSGSRRKVRPSGSKASSKLGPQLFQSKVAQRKPSWPLGELAI